MIQILSYDSIVEKLKNEYKDVPGIMDVKPSSFLDDEILVLIDRDLFKSEIPNSYEGILLVRIFIYDDLKDLAKFLDNLIINEFLLWETSDPSIEHLFFLRSSYEKTIALYENNKKYIKGII